MALQKLDFIFPFFVFFYGVLIVFVTEFWPQKQPVRARHLQLAVRCQDLLREHTPLAWICFWVGGFWSLQNLLFS